VSPPVTTACLTRRLPPIPPLLFPVSMDPGASTSSPAAEHPGDGSRRKPSQPPPPQCHGPPSPASLLSFPVTRGGPPSPMSSSSGTSRPKNFRETIQLRFVLLFRSTVRSVCCLDLTLVVDLLVCAERACWGEISNESSSSGSQAALVSVKSILSFRLSR
jgi:hypothetical protein